MKAGIGALGATAFLSVLMAVTFGEFRRSVDRLGARLDDSEHQLQRARIDLEQVRRDHATAAALWKRAEPRPVAAEELHHDVLAPSVQVNARGSVGGGTLLCSRENHTYVVTAYHVVQKIAGDDEETREPVEVVVYDGDGEATDTVPGDLVAWDEKKDLALLRLRTVREFQNVARLASRQALHEVRVFTPIYAVGCPLGHDPLPTLGEVATLNKEVNGEKFWMMNAPTIFGNSGGGIFHRETRELIGVSVMVCTYEGAVATPVPHLGILVSLEAVYDWLDSLHYQFVYDPEYPIDACETVRASARTAPLESEPR